MSSAATACWSAMLAVLAGTSCGSAGAGGLGPGARLERVVVIRMEMSAFAPALVEVPVGTTVRFDLVNDDPIDHEFIVGSDEVHRRHEAGTEPSHGDRPGEVSVPALARASTTFAFPAAGDVAYVCHLPGHAEYGMRGIVRVRPAVSSQPDGDR